MLKSANARRCWRVAAVASLTLLVVSQTLHAQPPCLSPVVAYESFDGDSFNLISGFDPLADNLDGGPGDFFGVGNIANWPQGTPTPGVPFSLADDSVFGVSTNGSDPPFPGDTEGVFGQNADFNNAFFAISDTRDFATGGELPSASWTFDISAVTCPLELHLTMGAQANDSNDGFPKSALVTFEYQIDGGPTRTAFSIAPNPDFGNFTYRAMDSGNVPPVGANGPLEATGDNPVIKISSDTGEIASETFLNKTPPMAAFGPMDSFFTELIGEGDELVVTMTANLEFEAMAFDDIEILRVPEPASWTMVGIGALLLLLRRRQT